MTVVFIRREDRGRETAMLKTEPELGVPLTQAE